MGCSIAAVNRPSLQLPPEDEDVKGQQNGIQTVSRVSAHNSTSPMGCHRVQPPPAWLLDQVAAKLRERMHLQLFNFDMIRPTHTNASGPAYPLWIHWHTFCLLSPAHSEPCVVIVNEHLCNFFQCATSLSQQHHVMSGVCC